MIVCHRVGKSIPLRIALVHLFARSWGIGSELNWGAMV